MEAKKVFKIGKSLHETLNKRKLDIFLNNLGICRTTIQVGQQGGKIKVEGWG